MQDFAIILIDGVDEQETSGCHQMEYSFVREKRENWEREEREEES